jgi:23S rRNA (cytosine1962-C5)-methyltransferase
VYDGDVLGWEPAPPPATHTGPVAMRDRRGRELGIADFSPHSKIRLRRLSANAGERCDRAFFRQRLEQAIAYRRRLAPAAEVCRLVSSEADGLPGLIVDQYGSALAVQTLSWAMAARQQELVADVEELLRPEVIVERNDTKVREREGLERRAGLLRGASARVEVTINGLKWGLDLLGGQKTGSFLDQRENWAAAARWATAFGVGEALDVFTYQGGFALHLARAGLRVEGVDSSRAALEAADANALRNELAVDWIEANAFDLLRDYESRPERRGMVVLDPPAFAKSRSALEAAAAGYKEINLRALKLVRPGGVLVTCSCSHHLAERYFIELIAAAAADARRAVTIVERRGQAPDHPVLLGMPESEYLKCLILAVH